MNINYLTDWFVAVIVFNEDIIVIMHNMVKSTTRKALKGRHRLFVYVQIGTCETILIKKNLNL